MLTLGLLVVEPLQLLLILLDHELECFVLHGFVPLDHDLGELVEVFYQEDLLHYLPVVGVVFGCPAGCEELLLIHADFSQDCDHELVDHVGEGRVDSTVVFGIVVLALLEVNAV